MAKEQQAIKWLQAHGYKQMGGQARTKMRDKAWKGKMRGGGTDYLTIAQVMRYYL